MSENEYLNKQKRLRDRPFITTKAVIMLIVLSGFIYLGFYSEYGGINDAECNGPCESTYGIWPSVLAFIIIFIAIIAAGALVGSLFASLRSKRNATTKPIFFQDDNSE